MVIINDGPRIDVKSVGEVFGRLGLKPPAQYVAFLLEHNGGVPCPSMFPILGFYRIRTSEIEYFLSINSFENYSNIESVYRRLKQDLPDGLIPIASASGGAKLVISCRQRDHGAIYYFELQEIDPDDLEAAIFPVALNFEQLLNSLVADNPKQ
ncbi:MAG: SMI1/KNR4 family protein [Phycisphaerales bacterium]|nr:SMI1/KNR4 family protein [Planctomycetota bacterium]